MDTRTPVCAVITTYRPDDGFPARVERIRSQVQCAVVVADDGEAAATARRLDGWFPAGAGIELVKLPANEGIARALNVGFERARAAGARWVVTFDDDSEVEPDMVATLVRSWHDYAAAGEAKAAVMGLVRVDAHTGTRDRLPAGQRFLERRGLITSGSLFSLESYDAVGPFREEFFIDFVDYDFCLRARAKGWKVIKARYVGMRHPLGAATKHRFGWVAVETTNHRALRRYYMVRNVLVLAREHLTRDPAYALAAGWFLVKTVFLVTFYEKRKCAKLCAMAGGFFDGVRRRLGKAVRDYGEAG